MGSAELWLQGAKLEREVLRSLITEARLTDSRHGNARFGCHEQRLLP
jgi:hypothetical protein